MDSKTHPLDVIAKGAAAAYGPQWQRPLARDAGIAVQTLNSLLSSRREPSAELIERIAGVLQARAHARLSESAECQMAARELEQLVKRS